MHNIDQPGHVAEVTSMLAHKSVNIATMQLYRESRGTRAVMVIECDRGAGRGNRVAGASGGILKVTYLGMLEA